MSVIAVSKSQEFLLKVRRLFILFFAVVFTSTRRIFFDDDTRDSTSTTSGCFLTTSYTNLTHDSLGPCEPSSAHNPNGISISAAVFAQITAECSYTLQWDAPSPSPQNCLPMGDLDPNLIHGSPGPPESSTQTASRSVQPFLHGSLV